MLTGLKKARFETIYKEGKRTQGHLIRMIAAPGEGRYGFATSKKIGNTPARNRCKRRLREAVRLQPVDLGISLDIVVIGLEHVGNAAFTDILAEVQSLRNILVERWEKQ